jgi:hypothetical protein
MVDKVIDTPLTMHATVRSQQRGVPPLVRDWLLLFGDERFDGHGGLIRYFSRRSVRQLERAVGSQPVRRMSEYMSAYLVEGSKDGRIITIGKRYKPVSKM